MNEQQIVPSLLKRLLIALTILFGVTCANVSEAAPFTESQFDRIFTDVTKNPAAAPESSATLDVNIDTLKERFNGFVAPNLKKILGTEDISAMEKLFLISDYKIFQKPDGDTFVNIFGSNVAIIGVTAQNGGNFKVLSCSYTAPEDKSETFFVQLILTGFVGSVAPEVSVAELMNELTAENSSGTVTKGNVTFSMTEDGNLDTLTATPAN